MNCQRCSKGYAANIKFPNDPKEYVLCPDCSRNESRKRTDRVTAAAVAPVVGPDRIERSGFDPLVNVGIFTPEPVGMLTVDELLERDNAPQS